MALERRALITGHWFREGDVQPSGYWICAEPGCGAYRADHAQARGDWRKAVHRFVPQRINPPRCHACGFHRSQTRHISHLWENYR